MVGCNEGGLVGSKVSASAQAVWSSFCTVQDFYRPIITPWELLLALQGPEHVWQPSKWTLDISKVLEAAKGKSDEQGDREPTEDKDEDAPVFSLVDGTYKTRRTFGTGEGATSGSPISTRFMTRR